MKKSFKNFKQAWYSVECSSPSIQDIKTIDTSRDAFDYVDFESVRKIFATFKVSEQIGS